MTFINRFSTGPTFELFAIVEKEPVIQQIKPLIEQFILAKIFYATLVIPDSAF